MGRFAYLNTEDESGRELLVELNMADYPDGGSIVFKSNGDNGIPVSITVKQGEDEFEFANFTILVNVIKQWSIYKEPKIN